MSTGEGSKPLFQRDDIVVNPKSVTNTATYSEKKFVSGSCNSSKDLLNQWRNDRHSSADSSSLERYQKCDSRSNECATGSNNRASQRTKLIKSTSDRHGSAGKRTVRRGPPPLSSHRQRTPEKLPYFLDEVREHDRIRRKYGSRTKKSSASPPLPSRPHRMRSRSKSRSRSRSSSEAQSKNHAQSQSTHHRRSISRDRYLGETSRPDRGKPRSDKVRYKTYTQYRRRSEDRNKSGRRRRSSRSTSRSRSRSRDRLTRLRTQSSHDERPKNRHGEHDGASNDALIPRNLPQPQIITIPVPVPAEFMNYSYPSWPTPTQWTPQMSQPPRYGTPTAYHLPTTLPAAVMPPLRPPLPPYGFPPPLLRYGGRGFRFPMHYGASRPWRPNFRSKNT